MADHLKYAGVGFDEQRRALADMILGDPLIMHLLQGMERLGLPDPLLCSGVLYYVVWNVLTGRPRYRGIKDADLAYFDAEDRSYQAEDRAIRRAQARFVHSLVPVEVRNQARVHLWFPEKFGIAYPPLRSSIEMLDYFTTKAYAVGARLERGSLSIFAPFGLDDLFSFRLRPNAVLPNKPTHDAKAARAMALWPELTFEPWPS